MGSAALAGLAVHADQPALGAADGRQVEGDAQVAGDPEAARVGAPVAVGNQQVRAGAQAGEGLEQGGHLAEGEVAGHVGKARPRADGGRLQHLEARGVEHHHGRMEDGAAALVGDVGARHAPHGAQAVALLDPVAKAQLERACLGHRDVPAVARAPGRHGAESTVGFDTREGRRP